MVTVFLAAALLNVYAALLVLLRGPLYRTKVYRPMLWNIVLSVIPVFVLGVGGLAGTVALVVSRPLGLTALAIVAVVWLLLLPNASYLITELNFSHRSEDEDVPLWYDIVLVITLAMSGVANAVVNVLLAHTVFAIAMYGDAATSLARPAALWLVVGVMLLLGLGMYLGRYLRLNSWDIKHPIGFARKIVAHFKVGQNALACLGFTLTYAIFLALIYMLVAGPYIEGLILVERVRAGG